MGGSTLIEQSIIIIILYFMRIIHFKHKAYLTQVIRLKQLVVQDQNLGEKQLFKICDKANRTILA